MHSSRGVVHAGRLKVFLAQEQCQQFQEAFQACRLKAQTIEEPLVKEHGDDEPLSVEALAEEEAVLGAFVDIFGPPATPCHTVKPSALLVSFQRDASSSALQHSHNPLGISTHSGPKAQLLKVNVLCQKLPSLPLLTIDTDWSPKA